MNRRRFAALPLVVLPLRSKAAALPAGASGQVVPAAPSGAGYAQVVPGKAPRFPDDEGSHPDFKIEWWYVTGWLSDEISRLSGFQITFFRVRPSPTVANPSRFASRQLYIAHVALSDPQRGRIRFEQRVARGAFDLARAAERMTDVAIGDWRLASDGDRLLRAKIRGSELAFELAFHRNQLPLLHGEQGVSRKGPSPESVSYYYSLPHLSVEGVVAAAGSRSRVAGKAWFDHEWSSVPMEAPASGWDWLGINLDDGGALMVIRMRSPSRANFWSGGTLRTVDGSVRTFSPQEVAWLPKREWRSPRTGVTYHVAWHVRVDEIVIAIEALMDDQELDARASVGTIYWEGAVTARVEGREVGRGYLEMTGYWRDYRL